MLQIKERKQVMLFWELGVWVDWDDIHGRGKSPLLYIDLLIEGLSCVL
jgi:hypothetical protein